MIPKAFIFDLDGVLVDTAHCHYQAWKKLADREGLCFDPKINQKLKGVSRQQSLEVILRHNKALDRYSEEQKQELARLKNEWYVQMIKRLVPTDVLPGVECFLKEARNANLRLAVASASRNAFTVLEQLELGPMFDYVADASQIKRSKPDPEVFLNCASAMGLDPADCVGFEDAQAGITAIHAAGMYAVGIGLEKSAFPPDISLSETGELNFNSILHRLARLPAKT